MAYIDKDIFINNELMPLVKRLDLCHPKQKKGVLMAIQKLNEEPTADVVEVVRCRDCVNSRPLCDTEKKLYCENCVGCTQLSTSYHSVIMFEDSFCSYGERKEVEE